MKIKKVLGREILDSRGLPTLQCEIYLEDNHCAVSSVPSGLSTGKFEALELRDKEKKRFFGNGVLMAIENLEKKIAPLLVGRRPDLLLMDKEIIELDGTENKSSLGANATLAASIAIARAQAYVEKKQLFEFLAEFCGYQTKFLDMPTVMFNILNGGAHASNDLLIQEFMIMPKVANSFINYLEMAVRVYRNLKQLLLDEGLSVSVGDEGGFAPVFKKGKELPEKVALDFLVKAIDLSGLKNDVVICLDVAASQFYDQNLKIYNFANKKFTSSDMVNFYEELVNQYPIYSIEDGLDEDDWEGWQIFTKQLSNKVQLVGDDLFVTNVKRIKKGVELGACNAVLIKPNQIGTVSQTIDAIKLCHEVRYKTVISHRSGETCDTFIADLVVGAKGGQLKAGAPARGERVAKYNRLLEIESLLRSEK